MDKVLIVSQETINQSVLALEALLEIHSRLVEDLTHLNCATPHLVDLIPTVTSETTEQFVLASKTTSETLSLAVKQNVLLIAIVQAKWHVRKTDA